MGDYILTDLQLMEGVGFCFDKVTRLLDNVESLLLNQKKFWETSHALGLYTFAIEEFGKGLLLKDLYQQGNQSIQVPTWIFSKHYDARTIKPHDEKINRAFNELPEACKKTMVGVVIDKPNPNTTELRFRDGGGMTIQGTMNTGLHMTDNNIDFDVRMKCFYLDWNDNMKHWDYELTTTKEYLQDAVTCFKKEMLKHKIP